MEQNPAFGIAEECFAAITFAKSINVVGAEVMQKLLGIFALKPNVGSGS
jgi:hypothetical protein